MSVTQPTPTPLLEERRQRDHFLAKLVEIIKRQNALRQGARQTASKMPYPPLEKSVGQ